MEEKADILYNKFMDSVFDLADELHDREEPLTENESTFLDSFDNYVDELVAIMDEDEKKIN
jgi:hypothetical protein